MHHESCGLSCDVPVGKLKALRERAQHIVDDFEAQFERVGVSDTPSFDRAQSHLEDKRRELEEEMGVTRDAISRATAIERRQLLNANIVRERDQRKRLAEANQALSTLRRAESRFRFIAERVQARSKAEADAAGEHHLTAIQECIDDLYPHSHLNEVEVDFAQGELLVRDRWIKDGVYPDDYASTGQANVLALSVFLGLALRQTFSVGHFVMLDEPVQNLDDLHFLAFLTLLKRVALSRQVIFSTADSNIAEIVRKQLRSWSTSDRTYCEYEWTAFDPKRGPAITYRRGRRIAAA